MRRNIFKIGLLFAGAALVFSACSKTPDVENTGYEKMAGEWFTQFYTGGTAVTDHHTLYTYNTSDPASGKMWVDDHDVWTFKAKVDVDVNALTFKAGDNIDNVAHVGDKVKIYEGKVIPGGGKSKSGNVVDSIYLRIEFSDDPGTIYEIRGHQRTGFFEDEY